MRRTASQTRDHVLDVASDLFYWQGIRATGIDTVAERAGVAPTTLYRVFASKDDLVAAYVERSASRYRKWFDAACHAAGPDPREQIVAVFEALAEQVQPGQCRGCPFLMTLAEFPDPAAPAHRHAVEVKAWVRSRLGELSAELTAPAPALADHLTLLMEGVYASVQALGSGGPARKALSLVRVLLAESTGPPPPVETPAPQKRRS